MDEVDETGGVEIEFVLDDEDHYMSPEMEKLDAFDYANHSGAYFYGHLLAYHFLDSYRNNPDETKEAITNFSLDSCKYKKIYLLDHYGLGIDNLKNPAKVKKLIYTKDYYK